MEILENKNAWQQTFRQGWLAHYQQTGLVDWKRYRHPANVEIPGVPGVQLSESRLLFVTSAGAYLRDEQEPFAAAERIGDYSIRRLPSRVPFAALAYAHDHYDHAMIQADPRVALPLPHLRRRVAEGRVAMLAPSIVSFMGYQPDSARVVDEVIPPILAIARQEQVDAALLAPI